MHIDVHELDVFVLWGSAITFLAILAVRVSSRTRLPSLLLYLFMGVALGEAGVGGIHFEDAELAHAMGFAALGVILAEGGLTTTGSDVRPSMRLGLSLATVGVLVSITVVAVGTHYLLGLSWETAVLLGAVTSPTDAAAVFSVLRVVPLPRRLTGALEAESGLNDAPTIVLVTLISTGALAEHGVLWNVGLVAYELIGGLAIGLGVGFVGAWVMRRAALPSSGLYPLATLVWAVFAYGAAAALHTSGFAAVYVAALLLGNAQLPHRAATRSFVEGIGWIAQIGLFVMLGLQAFPEHITKDVVVKALAAGLFLTLIARPVSVFASAVWFRVPFREQFFLSWAGLRGAVPIVLATIPLAEHVEDADFLFHVVLVFVIVFTFLQAPTLPLVARRLDLLEDQSAQEIEVEAAPLDRISADLLQVRIPAQSRLAGVEVAELRLPKHTVVSLIIRDERPFYPSGQERIKVGDELLIVTPEAHRERTEERLRALGRSGRLARWHTRRRDE